MQNDEEIIIFNIYLFSVEDIRYEKIKPQLDTATLNDCTEMKFIVPPSSDYFTRYTLSFFFLV